MFSGNHDYVSKTVIQMARNLLETNLSEAKTIKSTYPGTSLSLMTFKMTLSCKDTPVSGTLVSSLYRYSYKRLYVLILASCNLSAHFVSTKETYNDDS